MGDIPFLHRRSGSLRHAEAGIQWCAKGKAAVVAAGEQANDHIADPFKLAHNLRDEMDSVAAEANEGIAILG